MSLTREISWRVVYRGVDVTGACIGAQIYLHRIPQTAQATIRQETGELEIVTDLLTIISVLDDGEQQVIFRDSEQ